MLMLILMRRGVGWGRYKEGMWEVGSGLEDEMWMQMQLQMHLDDQEQKMGCEDGSQDYTY